MFRQTWGENVLGNAAVGASAPTAVVIAALAGIYQTALYRYAAEGADPAAFAGVGLQHLFPSR